MLFKLVRKERLTLEEAAQEAGIALSEFEILYQKFWKEIPKEEIQATV